MDLQRFDIDYLKSRHDELLKDAEKVRLSRRVSNYTPKYWSWFLNRLGDALITLGNKIKSERQQIVEFCECQT